MYAKYLECYCNKQSKYRQSYPKAHVALWDPQCTTFVMLFWRLSKTNFFLQSKLSNWTFYKNIYYNDIKQVKLEKLCEIVKTIWNWCQFSCFALIISKFAIILKDFAQRCDCMIAALRNSIWGLWYIEM